MRHTEGSVTSYDVQDVNVFILELIENFGRELLRWQFSSRLGTSLSSHPEHRAAPVNPFFSFTWFKTDAMVCEVTHSKKTVLDSVDVAKPILIRFVVALYDTMNNHVQAWGTPTACNDRRMNFTLLESQIVPRSCNEKSWDLPILAEPP